MKNIKMVFPVNFFSILLYSFNKVKMVEVEKKLSKKELKNLQHKAKSDESAKTKLEAYDKQQEDIKLTKKRELEEIAAKEAIPKKKRKTRRGKGGRTTPAGGFKATLFIGNIPKSITEEELRKHFESAAPFTVRMRLEKGFAFIEFIGKGDDALEKAEIHRRTQMALLLHHTKIGERTINVELSAGGGGNGAVRREKIVKKNEEAEKDRKRRITRENKSKGIVEPQAGKGVNPERLHLINS